MHACYNIKHKFNRCYIMYTRNVFSSHSSCHSSKIFIRLFCKEKASVMCSNVLHLAVEGKFSKTANTRYNYESTSAAMPTMLLCYIFHMMQVISATKYIVRKESTRDHVDLLLSSRHWPLVYAVDMACDVVAHLEVREPKLASVLWGDRRGCFQKPCNTSAPQVY